MAGNWAARWAGQWLTAAATAVVMLGSLNAAAEVQPLNGDPTEINFGIISTESTQNLRTQWEPVLHDMSEALGMPVHGFYASDYAAVIEAMRFGQVTVAWFGNASAIEAVDRAGGEVFARQGRADGIQGYYSHIIVNASSDIHTLQDLLGRCNHTLNFGMGDPNSTSGFLVPSYYVFALNHVNPRDCFANVRNANHETNLMAVANGQVDAATNNSEQLGRTRMTQPDVAQRVRVIWTSPLIPSDPLVYRADLSSDLKDRIRAFFLSYGRLGPNAARQREVLAAMTDGQAPYSNSSNAQLYPVREVRLYRQRLQAEQDSTLSDADRQARIAEIDRQLENLRIAAAAQSGM